MLPEDGLVREQIDYYNRRTTEYDATSTPEGDALESQGLRLEKALRDFRPEGRVLEVACGTGTWTRRLFSYADELTAVDSSADMIRPMTLFFSPAGCHTSRRPGSRPSGR